MDRWQVYELLKTSQGFISLRELEKMCTGVPAQELAEGIHEWLLTRKRDQTSLWKEQL